MVTARRVPHPLPVVLVALLLPLSLLAGCGGDDGEPAAVDADAAVEAPLTDEGAVDEPSGGDVPAPGGGSSRLDAGVDACALLDADLLADEVEFEFGDSVWDEGETEAAGACSWENPSKLVTVSVSVWKAEARPLDDLLTDVPDEHTAAEIPSPAGGIAWYNLDGDLIWKVHFPHGDNVVEVSQMPMSIGVDDLIGLAQEVEARLG